MMELSNGCVCDAVVSQSRTLATSNSITEYIHKCRKIYCIFYVLFQSPTCFACSESDSWSQYKLQGQNIPKRCTHVSLKIFEFWKICLETCIFIFQSQGFVPNSIQLHILVDWSTYDIHAICNVYGEFIPPHLSLILLYNAHDLVLIFPIAKSINELGQWKPQGHLHYCSWPTTMAQTNLMRKHWFFMASVVTPWMASKELTYVADQFFIL